MDRKIKKVSLSNSKLSLDRVDEYMELQCLLRAHVTNLLLSAVFSLDKQGTIAVEIPFLIFNF